MDSPPPSPGTPTSAVPPKRRRALRRFLGVSVFLVLLLGFLFLVLVSHEARFEWLTPAQIAQAGRPGLLTQMKYKLIRLAGPLMRYYHPHRPNILISSSIVQFSSATAQPALGAPSVTNSGGMSAWILSSSELASFRRSLDTNSGVFETKAPRILTSSGMRSVASVGERVALAPGIYADIGSTIDATAKASSSSINLLLNASSTELSAVSRSHGPSIKTNLAVGCRVVLPDAGGLVINCGDAGPANPANHWLIVSPVLVDATGQPLKR